MSKKETAQKHSLKPIALAISAAFAAGVAANAQADTSPFAVSHLSSGYMLDVHEGNCGGNNDAAAKDAEGKCGEHKDGEGKCGEGKCGEHKGEEGKCGEGKCGAHEKGEEGKCGEGKCGADKKDAEGKCGEGKCGGSV